MLQMMMLSDPQFTTGKKSLKNILLADQDSL